MSYENTMLSRYDRFKQEIEKSILNSVCYDFSRGSDYELGFRRHSGIINRVIYSNITTWLRSDLTWCRGKTCVINFAHYTRDDWVRMEDSYEPEDVRCTTTLCDVLSNNIDYYGKSGKGNTCLYTPDIVVVDEGNNGIGSIDVISCDLLSSECIVLDDKVKSSVCNNMLLVLHAAAYNKVDNIIICGLGSDIADGDLKWLVTTFRGLTELYKCYLSNVFYTVSDEHSYLLYKEAITNK